MSKRKKKRPLSPKETQRGPIVGVAWAEFTSLKVPERFKKLKPLGKSQN